MCLYQLPACPIEIFFQCLDLLFKGYPLQIGHLLWLIAFHVCLHSLHYEVIDGSSRRRLNREKNEQAEGMRQPVVLWRTVSLTGIFG